MSDKNPTVKQKLAFQKIVENRGNIGQGMKEAGYTEATAKNPSNLTNSEGWLALLEKYVPDEKLTIKLDEGLDANRTVSAKIIDKEATTQTDDFIDVPDFMARHKYLETALKLKQKLIERKDITTGGKPLPILDALSKDNSNQQNTKPA